MSDLISRQDAIDEIKALYEWHDTVTEDRILDHLRRLPSAEPKTGEWTNAGVLTVHCSNCKSEFHELEAMNYCPNCGARMNGGEEE